MDTNHRQEFFDAHASGWEDRHYPPEIRERLPELMRALALQRGARVLDVGCGTGVLIPYLREAVGAEGQIVALDVSPEMLKGAARKDAGRALILRAPAEELPLIDEYLDAIICFSAFPHFRNKEKVAREFYRTLRPGCPAFVAHLGTREEINAHHDQHAAVAGDHMPCPVGMNTIFTAAGFSRTHLDERPGWYLFSVKKEQTP